MDVVVFHPFMAVMSYNQDVGRGYLRGHLHRPCRFAAHEPLPSCMWPLAFLFWWTSTFSIYRPLPAMDFGRSFKLLALAMEI